MTLEQLQSMSDAELNELAAVKVMQYDKEEIDIKLMMARGEWNPTDDMNYAFELLRALGKFGILFRIRFSEIISKTFAASTGEFAAWPNVIFLLNPKHITIAAILASWPKAADSTEPPSEAAAE